MQTKAEQGTRTTKNKNNKRKKEGGRKIKYMYTISRFSRILFMNINYY